MPMMQPPLRQPITEDSRTVTEQSFVMSPVDRIPESSDAYEVLENFGQAGTSEKSDGEDHQAEVPVELASMPKTTDQNPNLTSTRFLRQTPVFPTPQPNERIRSKDRMQNKVPQQRRHSRTPDQKRSDGKSLYSFSLGSNVITKNVDYE